MHYHAGLPCMAHDHEPAMPADLIAQLQPREASPIRCECGTWSMPATSFTQADVDTRRPRDHASVHRLRIFRHIATLCTSGCTCATPCHGAPCHTCRKASDITRPCTDPPQSPACMQLYPCRDFMMQCSCTVIHSFARLCDGSGANYHIQTGCAL